jgi:hypothetical protein
LVTRLAGRSQQLNLNKRTLRDEHILRFSEGAQAVWRRVEKHHHDLMRCQSVNKKLASHIGKYDGLFARLCLIFHAIEHVHSGLLDPVSEDTAERVANFLHQFLLPQSVVNVLAAYFVMMCCGLSTGTQRANGILGVWDFPSWPNIVLALMHSPSVE